MFPGRFCPIYLMLPALACPCFSQEQSWQIAGTVYGDESKPLASVAVYVNNTSIGTSTDKAGKFRITVPARYTKVELVASFVGYKPEVKQLQATQGRAANAVFKLDRGRGKASGMEAPPHSVLGAAMEYWLLLRINKKRWFMKPVYLIVLTLLIAGPAAAQRSGALFQRNIDVHVDLVPLGFPDPAIRFGSEWMFGNRWSVGMNVGVGVPINGNTGFGFREPKWQKGRYSLFELRPEVKFYWLKRERIGWYIAAEGLISNLEGTTGKGYHFIDDNDTLQVNFDRADFNKTKIGIIGKIGGRMIIGKRMTMDFFTGMGLSKTNPRYSNYQNRTVGTSDPFFEGENYTAGKRITGHISFGLRMGILLWNKPR